MSDPLVSIVIPSYNSASYIKEAVRSALSQTYNNIEVLVVDDGSTDNTRELVREFEDNLRFRYIYQQNKGLAGARNTGVRESRGEFIALLDSDDFFHKDKVKEQIEIFLARPEVGVCYTDLIHFSDTEPRTYYHHRYFYPSGNIFEPLLRTQFINPLSVMVRREVFEKYGSFDESLRRSEDWELWLRWARWGVLFHFLPRQLAFYRMRVVGNLSSLASEPHMKEKNLEIFQKLRSELSKAEEERYRFGEIIKSLKKKLMIAYLMVGDKKKTMAVAREMRSVIWPIVIFVLPASIWRFILRLVRNTKHRRLLEKIETPSL